VARGGTTNSDSIILLTDKSLSKVNSRPEVMAYAIIPAMWETKIRGLWSEVSTGKKCESLSKK
jgi:hypothetical protein